MPEPSVITGVGGVSFAARISTAQIPGIRHDVGYRSRRCKNDHTISHNAASAPASFERTHAPAAGLRKSGVACHLRLPCPCTCTSPPGASVEAAAAAAAAASSAAPVSSCGGGRGGGGDCKDW